MEKQNSFNWPQHSWDGALMMMMMWVGIFNLFNIWVEFVLGLYPGGLRFLAQPVVPLTVVFIWMFFFFLLCFKAMSLIIGGGSWECILKIDLVTTHNIWLTYLACENKEFPCWFSTINYMYSMYVKFSFYYFSCYFNFIYSKKISRYMLVKHRKALLAKTFLV